MRISDLPIKMTEVNLIKIGEILSLNDIQDIKEKSVFLYSLYSFLYFYLNEVYKMQLHNCNIAIFDKSYM